MDDEQDALAITREMWDELTARMERDGDYTFNVSTSGTATTENQNRTPRVTGIDWSNGASSATVGYRHQAYDSGYMYAPYIPMLGSMESALGNQIRVAPRYHTFQPTVSAPYINLNFVTMDTGEWKVYVQPEDHFIDHEELFEI